MCGGSSSLFTLCLVAHRDVYHIHIIHNKIQKYIYEIAHRHYIQWLSHWVMCCEIMGSHLGTGFNPEWGFKGPMGKTRLHQ